MEHSTSARAARRLTERSEVRLVGAVLPRRSRAPRQAREGGGRVCASECERRLVGAVLPRRLCGRRGWGGL